MSGGRNKICGCKVTEQFLYEQLSKVSDIEIENYFNDLCSYGKLSSVEQTYKYITITNKFNESKIIVQKDHFRKYCGYQTTLDDYNKLTDNLIADLSTDTFSIDIYFEDKVANDISALLNEKQYNVTNYTLKELEQKFNIVDFLQITLNFDSIKS